MIVAHDGDALATLEKELENQGFNVLVFTDPNKALQDLWKNPKIADLVVSDSRMENMTGFELARIVKEIREDLSVILTSAFEINSDEFDKVLPSTRIDGFLTKPFHVNQLIDVIRQLD
ncbi:MAG: response regulator [Nitrososphaera sp.]|jgi:DNA-binding NtrC family response regulator